MAYKRTYGKSGFKSKGRTLTSMKHSKSNYGKGSKAKLYRTIKSQQPEVKAIQNFGLTMVPPVQLTPMSSNNGRVSALYRVETQTVVENGRPRQGPKEWNAKGLRFNLDLIVPGHFNGQRIGNKIFVRWMALNMRITCGPNYNPGYLRFFVLKHRSGAADLLNPDNINQVRKLSYINTDKYIVEEDIVIPIKTNAPAQAGTANISQNGPQHDIDSAKIINDAQNKALVPTIHSLERKWAIFKTIDYGPVGAIGQGGQHTTDNWLQKDQVGLQYGEYPQRQNTIEALRLAREGTAQGALAIPSIFFGNMQDLPVAQGVRSKSLTIGDYNSMKVDLTNKLSGLTILSYICKNFSSVISTQITAIGKIMARVYEINADDFSESLVGLGYFNYQGWENMAQNQGLKSRQYFIDLFDQLIDGALRVYDDEDQKPKEDIAVILSAVISRLVSSDEIQNTPTDLAGFDKSAFKDLFGTGMPNEIQRANALQTLQDEEVLSLLSSYNKQHLSPTWYSDPGPVPVTNQQKSEYMAYFKIERVMETYSIDNQNQLVGVDHESLNAYNFKQWIVKQHQTYPQLINIGNLLDSMRAKTGDKLNEMMDNYSNYRFAQGRINDDGHEIRDVIEINDQYVIPLQQEKELKIEYAWNVTYTDN